MGVDLLVVFSCYKNVLTLLYNDNESFMKRLFYFFLGVWYVLYVEEQLQESRANGCLIIPCVDLVLVLLPVQSVKLCIKWMI